MGKWVDGWVVGRIDGWVGRGWEGVSGWGESQRGEAISRDGWMGELIEQRRKGGAGGERGREGRGESRIEGWRMDEMDASMGDTTIYACARVPGARGRGKQTSPE